MSKSTDAYTTTHTHIHTHTKSPRNESHSRIRKKRGGKKEEEGKKSSQTKKTTTTTKTKKKKEDEEKEKRESVHYLNENVEFLVVLGQPQAVGEGDEGVVDFEPSLLLAHVLADHAHRRRVGFQRRGSGGPHGPDHARSVEGRTRTEQRSSAHLVGGGLRDRERERERGREREGEREGQREGREERK